MAFKTPSWNRRLFNRAKRWAKQVPRDELETHLAGLVVALSVERSASRTGRRLVSRSLNLADTLNTVIDTKDAALQRQREDRKRGAAAKIASDPRSTAMAQIRAEWEGRHRPGAAFAREMHAKYAGVITSERSIANAISRWRRQG